MKCCVDCKAPLPEPCGKKQLCDACVKRHKRELDRAQRRSRQKLKPESAQKRMVESLSSVAKEAAARGMTYGEYVVRLKLEGRNITNG